MPQNLTFFKKFYIIFFTSNGATRTKSSFPFLLFSNFAL